MHIKIPKSAQLGVGMIEILVALVVIAFSALGMAKLQALSVANATVSSSRGLVAMQAASLAAVMHGNAGYWQGGAGSAMCTGTTCSFSGGSTSVFGSAPALSACQSTTPGSTCTLAQIAGLDMNMWMANMNTQVPGYSAIITCANTPSLCTIQINWYEKAVGMNQTTSTIAQANTSTQQAYYLYVQP